MYMNSLTGRKHRKEIYFIEIYSFLCFFLLFHIENIDFIQEFLVYDRQIYLSTAVDSIEHCGFSTYA